MSANSLSGVSIPEKLTDIEDMAFPEIWNRTNARRAGCGSDRCRRLRNGEWHPLPLGFTGEKNIDFFSLKWYHCGRLWGNCIHI